MNIVNHSYRILGSIILCLFIGLLFLQIGTGFFSLNHSNALTSSLPKQQSVVPTPTTTPIMRGGAGGIGDTQCHSITSTPGDLLKLLAPGLTLQNLGEKYRNEKGKILCYDGWKSEWAVPGGTWVAVTDLLNTMHWPSDLFDPSAGDRVLITANPDALQPPSSPQQNQQSPPTCNWSPDLGVAQPTIDICNFAGVILKAVLLAPLKGVVNTVAGSTNSFLWTTPPKDSYLNPDLSFFWSTSLYIVNALIVVVLAWAGLRYMISQSLGDWLSYANLLEMLPRLLMALVAAYVSARVCQIVIDGSNALSNIFSTDLLSGLNQDPQNDLFKIFVQIFLCVTILLLILEGAIRLAILLVLIGFAPIWAFSGALRETQFIFKGGLKLLFFVSLLQPCQIAVLSLGGHLTKSIGGDAGSPLYYLVSVALMLFVLFMFGWFLRTGGLSMPFGAAGVVGALAAGRIAGASGRAAGRIAGASGRGVIAVGKRYRSGRTNSSDGGGSRDTGSGGSGNRGGGSNNPNGRGPNNSGGGGSNNPNGRGPNNSGGGGSNNPNGRGPNNSGGGGSNNPNGRGPRNSGGGSNNPDGTGRRNVRKLPPYTPFRDTIKGSNSAKQAMLRYPPLKRMK